MHADVGVERVKRRFCAVSSNVTFYTNIHLFSTVCHKHQIIKKVGAHNMTAKHNFAKLVTLVTNLVPQLFFLPLVTTTVAAWSTSFLIFSY